MYTVNFVNKNSQVTTPYVTFVQANDPGGLIGPALTATGGNSQALTNGTSYSISSLNNTISMGPTNWNGHLYISDAALVLPVSSAGCPTDPAYTDTTNTTRFQNLEFAGSPTSANVDITYINWYSLPLEMESTSQQSSGGHSRGRPKSSGALSSLSKKLAGLTNDNPITVVKNANQIVRVISPNAGTPSWLPLYPSFSKYLNHIFIDSMPPLLQNTYNGIQSPPSPNFQQQTYTVSDLAYNGLALNIGGTTSVLGNFTMTTNNMIVSDFSSVIYMAVMNYAWTWSGGSNPNGNTGDNDVFSAISRDLMAGFAFGFIVSTQYGSQPSSAWQAAPANKLFSTIQPAHPYYNPWANGIYTCFSDVYSFPFNDYLTGSAPELAVNNGDTLTVTLLP